MKTLDIRYLHGSIDSTQDKPDLVIVIDILRATSTIPVMLSRNVKKIIPVIEIKEVFNLKKIINKNSILCGERDGKKIEGFDYGNSPLEFENADIEGKTVIMSSTNGTPTTIKAAELSEDVVFGSFINFRKLIDFIKGISFHKLLLLTSGTQGEFSLEDSVFAGLIVKTLVNIFPDIKLSDSCFSSMIHYEFFQDDIRGMMNITKNGRILRSIHHDPDLDFCAELNTYSIIPVLHREGDRIYISNKHHL
ncbi:2-phosphosulfolactate phosphatase [Candidatus Dependentiae bacterium]|nr:2-phosphosulfolactate phosphatase [Candidatus Dependentiae bacterium]